MRHIEYTPMGTTYTYTLEELLARGKIILYEIKSKTETTKQSKSFEPTKYCKYNQARGHDTENRLERMFRSG